MRAAILAENAQSFAASRCRPTQGSALLCLASPTTGQRFPAIQNMTLLSLV
jgi:hypothetical protein